MFGISNPLDGRGYFMGGLMGGITSALGGMVADLASALFTLLQNAFMWLINEAGKLIAFILGLIPQIPFWSHDWPSISDAITVMFQWIVYELNVWNYYVCMDLMFIVILTTLVCDCLLVVWDAIRWIISFLPFVGGGGE